MHTLIHAHPLLTLSQYFISVWQRKKRKETGSTHIKIVALIRFLSSSFPPGNPTYHNITGQLVDSVISLHARSGRWEQRRFMFSTFVRENQRQLRNSARLKRSSDRKGERGEKTSAFSARTVNNHLYVCPPVVSKIAHTKSPHPGGIKTNPKIISENIHSKTKKWCKNTDVSLLICLQFQISKNPAKFHWAKLNILTLYDQIGIHWRQKWNHY